VGGAQQRLEFCLPVLGTMAQASAPGTGHLSVVEPVLVLELPFTLIVGSWMFDPLPVSLFPKRAPVAGAASL
jgi:hypothetical protein